MVMKNTGRFYRAIFFGSILMAILAGRESPGQVSVRIDAGQDRVPVSSCIYGRNNSFSATRPDEPIPLAEITRNRDAGVRFFRQCGGNNATKYNWKKKLSSHPDWYNNVYTNDWDAQASAQQQYFPDAQGMWAFQLIGKAAKTSQHNFNDWGYNSSQWWEGVQQNLAGGGTVNPAGGSTALSEGNPDLYLQDWPADSTVGMLEYWFEDKRFRKEQMVYWSLDNEPEIWSGTHDDVMPVQPPANDFIERYVEVALRARAYYPGIKLTGPVVANEWQWYNWNNSTVQHEGRRYCWLEFFIKRIAEEELRTGVRLLDVVDIHFYPQATDPAQIVQLHRVFFDRTYDFPEANGVKNISGSWDNSETKEYVLGRVRDWLDQYFGEGHRIGLGVTETGLNEPVSPSVAAVWYASTMGEFMRNGVELFAPWYWHTGMWETLSLFSNYNKAVSVRSVSSDENTVSAYPSVSPSGDSMTVVLVNRSLNSARTAEVELSGFRATASRADVLALDNLPSGETFISAAQNALKRGSVEVSPASFELELPPLSVVSVLLKGTTEVTLGMEATEDYRVNVYPNPVDKRIVAEWNGYRFDSLWIVDMQGRVYARQQVPTEALNIEVSHSLQPGTYFLCLSGGGTVQTRKLTIR